MPSLCRCGWQQISVLNGFFMKTPIPLNLAIE
jgi:hypothetical protein